jgi:hypothetical protein
MDKIKVRKLPKKTKIIFFILIIISILVYFSQKNGKEIKAFKILNKIGYSNIVNLKVYSKTQVEDKITRIQGYKYFVIFKNQDNNKTCRGFIYRNFKNKTAQDLSCK